MVSQRLLLEGAWYSYEQCGILLRDAVALHDSVKSMTAVGLAMLAREELGKARILLDLWREAERGREIQADEILDKLDDHEAKQRKAQISHMLRTSDRESVQGKLLWTTMRGETAQEREAARQKLDELTQSQRRRIPTDRHKARMRALYVDLDEQGTGWNRPVEMPNDARALIEDAANDYALQYDRFQGRLEILAHIEPKLADALAQWPERPALPAPVWPKFPPDPLVPSRAKGSEP